MQAAELSQPGALQLKTAACYVRVSTDMQTTLNQKMELTKYAEANKLHILNFFEDEAVSGTVAPLERPGFKALMDFIKNNKVDHVLIFDLTRIGRTFWDTLMAIREIDRYSVIISASPKEAFLNMGNESMRQIFLSMLAWFAEREREMMIERIKAGMARAKAQGIKAGRREKPLSDRDILQAIEYLKMPKQKGTKQRMELAARQFGISHKTLYDKLTKAGYLGDKIIRIDADKVLDLVDAGAPQVAIGKALGVSTEDAAYAIRRMNIQGICRRIDGKIVRPYCIVKYRPSMTILRYRKYRKLRLQASLST